MQKIEAFIEHAEHLPPAPRILPQLWLVLEHPDSDTSKVVDLITYDPALTASMLRTCNSAYFRGDSPVHDLQEAVTRLGFAETYRLVAATVGSRTFRRIHAGNGNGCDLWKHSATSAVAAQLMARNLGGDEGLVFTAALLHDIGKIVLCEVIGQPYFDLVKQTENCHASLLELEKEQFGAHHAEVGARLMERWQFPAEMVAAVRFHHQPADAGPHQRLAAHVYLANAVSYFMGHNFGSSGYSVRNRVHVLKILGLAPDDLPQYITRTFAQFDAIETLLHIT